MKCAAASAPVMNHLRPVTTQRSFPRRSARVRIMEGSEPPPGSGSVMTKEERTSPRTIGASQRARCRSVPAWASTRMLPSSGAAQLRQTGPKTERLASSYIAACATIDRPMPPSAGGTCGAQRPAARARARAPSSGTSAMFSCASQLARSASIGSTTSSTKARVRRRISSASGGRVKSMAGPQREFTWWPPSTVRTQPVR